ncbi:hypothetical protein HNY73_015252 [Argiope bruennichi]|uniref:Uncharacterized protein n=1 Tax=Argiope bruennichi TaxID=94029 RepID=A0A8T0ESW4_ARGBR|nr:hypothetical protein HNY73_015252 [Argiope bruennichi]
MYHCSKEKKIFQARNRGEEKHGLNEEKILEMRRFTRFSKKKRVISVLDLMSFFEDYIQNYAMVPGPVTDLTKKNKSNVILSEQVEKASFENLKELLSEISDLVTSDANLSFQVD